MTTGLLDPPTLAPVPSDDATRRELLAVGVALALGLAACGEDAPPAATATAGPRCRRLGAGAADPQRVVAVDRGAADIAPAAGITPIGVADEVADFPYLQRRLEGVPRTGAPDALRRASTIVDDLRKALL